MTETKRIFLLGGKETLLKNDFILETEKKLNFDRKITFFADEVSFNEISENLFEESLFPEKRLFILRNLAKLKKTSKKNTWDTFLKKCLNLVYDENILIVFDFETIPSAFLDEFQKKPFVYIKVFKSLYGKDIQNYIKTFLQKRGFTVTNEEITLILEITNQKIENIRFFCEKLILNTDQKKITKKEIEEVFFSDFDQNIFDFISLLCQKKKKKALLSLYSLRDTNESLVLINTLLFRATKILWNLKVQAQNPNLSKELGVSPFEIKKYYFYIQNFTLKDISSLLTLCSKLELISKSEDNNKGYILLEEWILLH